MIGKRCFILDNTEAFLKKPHEVTVYSLQFTVYLVLENFIAYPYFLSFILIAKYEYIAWNIVFIVILISIFIFMSICIINVLSYSVF
jgi:hypothetical protein